MTSQPKKCGVAGHQKGNEAADDLGIAEAVDHRGRCLSAAFRSRFLAALAARFSACAICRRIAFTLRSNLIPPYIHVSVESQTALISSSHP